MERIEVGKTTLMNMICGTNREAGAEVESTTRQLFLNDANAGPALYPLIDTYKTNSSTQT